MLEQVIDTIQTKIGIQVEATENTSPEGIVVTSGDLVKIMQLLYSDEALYFDMLSCITGVDDGPEENTMEVIYNLNSIPYEQKLMVKVVLDREKPEVPSLAKIWKTADWQEREVFDLFGIQFTGHPDLRRILMPTDWEGYPLRKDYENPEKYRGMSVEYDRSIEPNNE